MFYKTNEVPVPNDEPIRVWTTEEESLIVDKIINEYNSNVSSELQLDVDIVAMESGETLDKMKLDPVQEGAPHLFYTHDEIISNTQLGLGIVKKVDSSVIAFSKI